MAETITFRLDEDARRALVVLTQDGTAVATAIRAALIEAAKAATQAGCVQRLLRWPLRAGVPPPALSP